MIYAYCCFELTRGNVLDAEVSPPTNPLATEVLDNLNRYPHCILLTRVGQFYESYFDQAAEVSRLLNIKLAKKTWGGQRILMCGFPIMHLHKYLKILVQDHNRFVAMCEELRRDRPLDAKGTFERRVMRIVTPGTLIDEPFLNPYENNFLLSVSPVQAEQPSEGASTSSASNNPVGLAWIDVSTGEFYTKTTTVGGLRDEVVRLSPKEVILDERLRDDDTSLVRKAVIEEDSFVSYFALPPKPSHAAKGYSGDQLTPDELTAQIDASKQVLPAALTSEEGYAVELLTAFMHANLMDHMPSLASPNRELSTSRMQIDSHTVKALEFREGLREGGTAGSLLSVIKRTVTSSGTRLLARWLCSPSTSVAEINARQSLVAFFHARPFLRQDLVQSLRDAEDATRIVQKFLLGRGSFQDLTAICTTVDIWSSIKERILMEKRMEGRGNDHLGDAEWASIETLMEKLSDLEWLASRVRAALVPRETAVSDKEVNSDEPFISSMSLVSTRDPRNLLGIVDWTIRPTFSEHLTNLHSTLQSLLAQKDSLERRLQITYAAPSLTLRASPGQGMHVHVARKTHASQLKKDKDFVSLSESVSTCTFFHQGWSQLAMQINETAFAIAVAEKEAFEILRNDITSQSASLRRNARIIDELDVTLAFANLAVEMRFVRPVVNEGSSYHVVNGRHPTVELGLLTSGRTFTPNTVTFTPNSQLQVITGPNMAGKSTLLRQTALIAILAQLGSYVPADSAEVGIVDRVFSRVGAKDDLFRDRSTFMVEMLEASDILRRATPRSLVIMDEVGRGTTVADGLAIAFATVHHLLSVNGCRVMFATHFHELADMLGHDVESHHGHGAFSKVAFFCTDVDEIENGYFTYSHRVRPGVNRDSHGLKVAQLAGMPDSAVDVARSALDWLKKRSVQRADSRLDLRTLGQVLVSPPRSDVPS
ncbi:muts domain V-domain-containing protein [Ganoderma leucocontextum]|nr:muts domain V-domain-containing protein [Ganoderma leucocontextum]